MAGLHTHSCVPLGPGRVPTWVHTFPPPPPPPAFSWFYCLRSYIPTCGRCCAAFAATHIHLPRRRTAPTHPPCFPITGSGDLYLPALDSGFDSMTAPLHACPALLITPCGHTAFRCAPRWEGAHTSFATLDIQRATHTHHTYTHLFGTCPPTYRGTGPNAAPACAAHCTPPPRTPPTGAWTTYHACYRTRGHTGRRDMGLFFGHAFNLLSHGSIL